MIIKSVILNCILQGCYSASPLRGGNWWKLSHHSRVAIPTTGIPTIKSSIKETLRKYLFQEYEHALKFYYRGEKYSRKNNIKKFSGNALKNLLTIQVVNIHFKYSNIFLNRTSVGIRVCKEKIFGDLNAFSLKGSTISVFQNAI